MPLLELLSKADPSTRKRILRVSNFDLIKAIVECVHNVLKGNVQLKHHHMKQLKKHKKNTQKNS